MPYRRDYDNFECMKAVIRNKWLTISRTVYYLQFLATAVSEAEQVLDDLRISLAEQKELLDFTAHQQEKVWFINF